MRKLMMLVALLSLVLFSSCDKKDVEPKGELIEVSFNAALYALDFETNMKSVPGYPDIPHRTDLDLYSGRIELQGVNEDYVRTISFDGYEFSTLTTMLEANDYTVVSCIFHDLSYTQYGGFFPTLYGYVGSSIINDISIPEPVYISINDLNSQIDVYIAPMQSCYVFSDPDNLLVEITQEGNIEGSGILKSQMNTVVDEFGDTFHYFYYDNSNLWIYTTEGRLNLNFGDYINTLSIEDQEFYIPAFTGSYAPNQPQPFTVYTTVTNDGTSGGIKSSFEVSILPNVEVEITLE